MPALPSRSNARERLRADAGEVQRERAATEQALARARAELARAAQTLAEP